MGKFLNFVSGKGGMGKTCLCAAIATALAHSGKNVLCIDCDNRMGDLGRYLALGQMPDLTYSEVCRGDYSLDYATAHPDFPNLRYLAAPLTHTVVDENAWIALLHQASDKFDYILLDSPKMAVPDGHWVLITHANPAAISGAQRMAEDLEIRGAKDVHLVVNCVDPREMASFKLTVDDVMDQAGLPLLGVVPCHSAVMMAAHNEKPLILYTKKGASAACLRIAERIQDRSVRIPGRLI